MYAPPAGFVGAIDPVGAGAELCVSDGGRFGSRHAFHDLQQRPEIASLLIERVRGNAEWYVIDSKRTAHRDYLDRRKAAANHGKKFKAVHAGHIEIGKNNVGNFHTNFGQGRETIRRTAHTMSKGRKNMRQRHSECRVIVNDQKIHRRYRASCTFRSASNFGCSSSLPLLLTLGLFNSAQYFDPSRPIPVWRHRSRISPTVNTPTASIC